MTYPPPYDVFSESMPFFTFQKRNLASKQLSRIGKLINEYRMSLPLGDKKKDEYCSVYLPRDILYFLLNHAEFEYYSDFGYSYFGHTFHELPYRYDQRMIVITPLHIHAYDNILEDKLEHKLVYISHMKDVR